MERPEMICRAALIAVGVPRAIVDELKADRIMDVWVQLAVLEKVPWRAVNALIEKARAEVLAKVKSET